MPCFKYEAKINSVTVDGVVNQGRSHVDVIFDSETHFTGFDGARLVAATSALF